MEVIQFKSSAKSITNSKYLQEMVSSRSFVYADSLQHVFKLSACSKLACADALFNAVPSCQAFSKHCRKASG